MLLVVPHQVTLAMGAALEHWPVQNQLMRDNPSALEPRPAEIHLVWDNPAALDYLPVQMKDSKSR
jgi:hypothetical protein